MNLGSIQDINLGKPGQLIITTRFSFKTQIIFLFDIQQKKILWSTEVKQNNIAKNWLYDDTIYYVKTQAQTDELRAINYDSGET